MSLPSCLSVVLDAEYPRFGWRFVTQEAPEFLHGFLERLAAIPTRKGVDEDLCQVSCFVGIHGDPEQFFHHARLICDDGDGCVWVLLASGHNYADPGLHPVIPDRPAR